MIHTIRFLLLFIFKTVWKYKTFAFLAALSVIFGTALIITTQSITNSIKPTLNVEYQNRVGGEIILDELETEEVRAEDLNYLINLKNNGEIDEFTIGTHSLTPASTLIKSTEGKTQTIRFNIGIDPEKYPIVGDLQLQGPDQKLSELDLTNKVILSYDLAKNLDVERGKTISVLNPNSYETAELEVAGIAIDTPSKSGRTAYYDVDTAINTFPELEIRAYLLSGNTDQTDLEEKIIANTNFSEVDFIAPNTQSSSQAEDVMNLGLNGLGILGLILSAVGIVNAFKVLAEKLSGQIGILKSIGYSNKLIFSFLISVFMSIGLTGSLIGAIVGWLFSDYLYELLISIGGLLITPGLSIEVVFSSLVVLVGLTIILGIISSINLIYAQPAEILSDHTNNSGISRWKRLVIGLVIFAIASILASIILKNIIYGFTLLTASLVSIFVLQLIIKLFLKLILLIPIPFLDRRLKIAKLTLKNEVSEMALPVMAILIGMVVFSFVLSLRTSINNNPFNTFDTENLYSFVMFGEGENYNSAFAKLERENEQILTVRQTPATVGFSDALEQRIKSTNFYDFAGIISPVDYIQVRNDKGFSSEYTYTEFKDSEQETGAYIPQRMVEIYGNQSGNDFDTDSYSVTLEIENNETGLPNSYEIPIIGTYNLRADESMSIRNQNFYYLNNSIIFEESVAEELGIITSLNNNDFNFKIEAKSGLDDISNEFFVLTVDELEEQTTSSIQTFSQFALILSSLSIVAAVILIFTIASLSIEKRRKKFIMLRAVGYSKFQIILLNIYQYLYLVILAVLLSLVITPQIINLLNNQYSSALLTYEFTLSLVSAGILVAIITISIGLLTTNSLRTELQELQKEV